MARVLKTKIDGTQHYDIRVLLDGTTFILDFLWNSYRGFWTMLVSAADGTPLVRTRVVVGTPLLAHYRIATLPLGDFVAVDTSGSDSNPGLEDLGDRVQLVYVEAADVTA